MNLRISFLLSAFFHLSIPVIYILYSQFFHNNRNLDIPIQKGLNSSYPMQLISFKFTDSDDQKNNVSSSETLEGARSDEIKKIQNKIVYPPLALENGWEAQCEWSVTIGKEGKISGMDEIRKCKYHIFEKEFMRVINDWNFNLPENTILKIPVNFRIQRE